MKTLDKVVKDYDKNILFNTSLWIFMREEMLSSFCWFVCQKCSLHYQPFSTNFETLAAIERERKIEKEREKAG